ncbi:MAG TPA: DnaJ domain-containing protein [Candidatus Limnocylindria bacterium]|nr:DnaJ domain-containing protein [Candidatus Limnocylindria bacterium]
MGSATLDPYATLGIPSSATRAEAARAHRRLAMQFHPDRNPGPGAAARMRRINEAWRILRDPARRSLYDAERRVAAWAEPAYRPPPGSATWAPWPESSRATPPPVRRRARPRPGEREFGDRPAVVGTVAASIMLLYFIATWLGSIAR